MPSPSIRLDYFDGTNWVQALTHANSNAVLSCEIEKTIDAPGIALLLLSNRSQNYSSTTTSKSASNSSQGKLTGIFTEFMDCRLRDEETGTMLYRGRVVEEQNQYSLQAGSTIRLRLREVSAELADYALDNAPNSLKAIDIETSSQTPDTQKRSGVVQKILSTVSSNFDTDDTSKFEASQVAFTENERTTGEKTSNNKDALDITKSGKGQLLRTIHALAMTDPHSATDNKHFGYDFYVDPNITSLVSTHNPNVDFNYFRRGTRPGVGGSTSADPTKYGVTIEYPSAGWGGQTNFKRAMLSDCEFDSSTAELYTSVIAHYTETAVLDSGMNTQYENIASFEILPGTIVGALDWSGKRLTYIKFQTPTGTDKEAEATNPLLLYRANPATALNGAINASVTSVVVDSVTDFVVGQIITVDSEKMTITAINTSTNTFTVTRASSSTSAASHSDDATVTGTVVNPCATLHYQSGTGSSQYIIVSNIYDEATTYQFTNYTGLTFDPFPTSSSSTRFFLTAGTAASSTAATQLNEALDDSETAVDVDSGAVFAVNQIITCESEQMLITAISTNTLTVTRGYNGTTAAAHDDDTAITGYYIDLTPSTARRKTKLSYVKPYRLESRINIARDAIRDEIISLLDTTSTGQITRATVGTVRYPYVKLESAAANVSRSSNVLTFATAPTATTQINMAGNINTSATELVVDSASGFSVNDIIVCENEQMQITAIDSNTFTVSRGVNSTTAASHNDNTAITGVGAFTPADGTSPGNNPLSYGVKVGMSVAELSTSGKTVTRYAYVSAVNSTTITYGASATDTSDGTALDASKPIAVYIPSEPGHCVQVKNNLWNKNYKVLLSSIRYSLNNGVLTTYLDGYGLDINDEGIPATVPSTKPIDVDFPSTLLSGGTFWSISNGKIQAGHSSTAADNYKTVKVTANDGTSSTVTLITHPDGKSYILKTGNYDISGSGNTANQWHTLFLRPLAEQDLTNLTNDHQSLQIVANASNGNETLYTDISDSGDIILGRAKTNVTLSATDDTTLNGGTPDYEGLAILELTNNVGAIDGEQGFSISAAGGSTNQLLTVNSAGFHLFTNSGGTQVKAVSMDNMGVPRITVGDSQAPENTTQIATTGTLYAVPSQKTTTLNMAGNLNATATEITLDSTAGFVAGDIIQIATSGVNYGSDPEVHEQIKIDSVDSSSVLTVTRSFNGTAGVSYVDNANIKGYQGHNEAKTFPNIPLQFHHNISAVLSETRSSTQLAEALDNSETQIDVDSTSGFLVGQYFLVDSEVMKITAISGTTRFTVLRGQEGTSAATHNDNTAVKTWVNSNFGQTATEIYRQGYTMSSTTYQDSAYNTGDNPGRGRNLIIHDDGGEQRNPEIPKDLTTNYETLQVASRLVANNLAIQAPRFYGSTWGTGTAQSQLHPTYSFSTDLDTGMYQEAANQLDWSVGGVREMTLVGDGLTIHGNLTIDGTFSNTEASQFGGKVALNFDDAALTADGTTATLVAHYGGTYYAGFPRGRLAHIQPGDRLFIDVAQHADNHQEDIRITNASADGTSVDIRRPNAGVTSIGGTTMKFLTTGTDYTATDTVLVISTDAWLDPGSTRRQAELTVAGTGEKLRVINKTTVGSEDAITVERGYMGTTAAAITHNTAFTVARSGSFSAASGTYNSHLEAFLGRQFECGNILALPFNQLLDNDASADYNPGTLAGTTVGADRYLCDIRPAYSFQQDQGAGMWLMTTTTGNMLGFTVGGTELLSVGFNGNIASEHAAKLYIGRNWEGATNTGNTYHEVTTIVHGNIIPDRNGTMSSGPAQSYTHSHTIGTNAYPWHGFWSESNVNVTSDIRIKENITDITNGLDIIMALSPIKYNKLEETEIEFGFSAQDVKAQLLNLGYSEDISIYSDDEDIWSLQYEQLIAPLVAAIQELKAELDKLKNG